MTQSAHPLRHLEGAPEGRSNECSEFLVTPSDGLRPQPECRSEKN